MALEAKIEKLKSLLKPLPGLSLALSGGLDSSVLLVLACHILGKGRLEALTVSSEIMPEEDLLQARLLTAELGIPHRIVTFDHLRLDAFRKNPPDRCYHCKRAMFEKLKALASFPLADGTQAEDLAKERPGMKALKELEILSPLREAGFTKGDLRTLAKRKQLVVWRREALPCLATRFLPGEEITPAKLELVKRAEDYLKAQGLRKVRVRYARAAALIEVDSQDLDNIFTLRAEVAAYFRALGFHKVSLSLEGYGDSNP